MATPRTAPADGYAATIDSLLAIEWPVVADRVHELIERCGWTVVSSSTNGGLISVDNGWGLSVPRPVRVHLYEGELAEVTVKTAEFVEEPSPESTAVLRDAFADQIGAVEQRLGAPTSRPRGDSTTAVWEMDNGARLTVRSSASSADTEIASPAEAKSRRDAGE